jgi:hypothetical protein
MITKIVVSKIEKFAAYLGHEWAAQEGVEFWDALPNEHPATVAGEEAAILTALNTLETARKETSNPRLPAGIGVWDSFKTFSDDAGSGRKRLVGYSHQTGTGRTRLDVNEDGVFTLSIWRPTQTKGVSFPVLAVAGRVNEEDLSFNWGDVEIMTGNWFQKSNGSPIYVTGQALERHWRALIEAMDTIAAN